MRNINVRKNKFRGNKVCYDGIDWKYKNNNGIIDPKYEKPYIKCGERPTLDGDDYCLQHLNRVTNACCGHGGEGHIQFDNEIIIRGYFTIEKD